MSNQGQSRVDKSLMAKKPKKNHLFFILKSNYYLL
jgi:hypothetical protein